MYSKKYIEEMTQDERMEYLDKLGEQIFYCANAFALEKRGAIGCTLHESVNQIMKAEKMFNGEEDEVIGISAVMRSMGVEI